MIVMAHCRFYLIINELSIFWFDWFFTHYFNAILMCFLHSFDCIRGGKNFQLKTKESLINTASKDFLFACIYTSVYGLCTIQTEADLQQLYNLLLILIISKSVISSK